MGQVSSKDGSEQHSMIKVASFDMHDAPCFQMTSPEICRYSLQSTQHMTRSVGQLGRHHFWAGNSQIYTGLWLKSNNSKKNSDLRACGANAGATPFRTVFQSQSPGSLCAVTKSAIPAGPMSCSADKPVVCVHLSMVRSNTDRKSVSAGVYCIRQAINRNRYKVGKGRHDKLADLSKVNVIGTSWFV